MTGEDEAIGVKPPIVPGIATLFSTLSNLCKGVARGVAVVTGIGSLPITAVVWRGIGPVVAPVLLRTLLVAVINW